MVSSTKDVQNVSSATVRFAGDSGDGMQLAGMHFTDTSAIFGNDVATMPDYPAEIRAPIGTVAGVSGFQINFASQDIFTPGDEVHALIAMNPAAFKANLADVQTGGIVIVNDSEFTKVNLRKAGYEEGYNPLEDEALQQKFKIYQVPITRHVTETLSESGLGNKEIVRNKNMYALGLIYYLYDRPLETTIKNLQGEFARKKGEALAGASVDALKAGYYFGETAEIFPVQYQVEKAKITPGTYRRVTGNEATALGLAAAAKLADKDLIYCTYPITPASDILHHLAAMRHFGVKTFQAEDEIAGMCSAIGVAFAGQLGVTGTSGPGLALKSEAIGLAAITELPVVIVNVQRGGPSTGQPTKTEQSDLLQAMYGRNGDCPVVVIAAQSPSDCFDMAIEATRIAVEIKTPVILLTDGYIANGAEPWRVPNPDDLEPIVITHPSAEEKDTYHPYSRDENGARPWAIPGTAELQHRIGGLEKQHISGNVSYDPQNHQLMTELRQAKIDKLAERLPKLEIQGEDTGDLLLLGWGGTYGAITSAASILQAQGHKVSAAHIKYISPFPSNLGDVLKGFKNIIIPELNCGQLRMLIRDKFLVDARGLNKIQGLPFLIEEIVQGSKIMLDGKWGDHASLQPLNHTVRLEDQGLEQQLKAAQG